MGRSFCSGNTIPKPSCAYTALVRILDYERLASTDNFSGSWMWQDYSMVQFICCFAYGVLYLTLEISSTVIEEVKDLCRTQDSSCYAYFFFDSRNADKGLILYENMLRSLLSQLSSRCGIISDAVKESFQAHRNGQEQPSLKALQETLVNVIDEFDHVYLIIDSLDECGDRIELLQWVKDIARQARQLHLLLASRPEPDVTNRLDALSRVVPVRFNGTALRQDIGVYLDDRLSLINRWDMPTRDLIKTTLIGRSDGMYVALQSPHCRNSPCTKV